MTEIRWWDGWSLNHYRLKAGGISLRLNSPAAILTTGAASRTTAPKLIYLFEMPR